MDISSQLTESPGLIALIDNPTEGDLLKVIYSENILDSIIRDLPDKCIIPEVATIALRLSKEWSKYSLTIWFDKFFPHVLPEDQLKVLKSIYKYLPSMGGWVDKNIDLFIDLFSHIDNPSEELIDYYLTICIRNGYLGIGDDNFPDPDIPRYHIIDSALTSNLVGRLSDSQQKKIINLLSNRPYVNIDLRPHIPYRSGSLKSFYKDWDKFITNKVIYEEGKNQIDLIVKEMQDYWEKETKIKNSPKVTHWWQKLL